MLTPEEYVRQNFIHFLINEKQFPKGLTAVEHSLKLYGRDKRADIVTYNNENKVVVITECKAPSVKITQKAFDQIAHYNMVFKAKYLLVTNGLNHYCCMYTSDTDYEFIRDIPNYNDLV